MATSIADLQTQFLSAFGEYSKIIVEFSKLITEETADCDLAIFMARKSVCLLEALITTRLAKPQCIITSQRVLEYDSKWLKGKTVYIFDDALITGTTLYKTRKVLEILGCKVKIFVLCINKDWWTDQLVVPDRRCPHLNDSECATLCSKIVDSISLIPIPYATDFPFFSSVRLSSNNLYSLVSSFRWAVADMSTNLQHSLDIFTKTFDATDYVYSKCRDAFGSIIDRVRICKIRLYGRPFYGSEELFWCNILPIVALEPMDHVEIDNVCDLIFKAYPDLQKSFIRPAQDVKKSYKSKLRLIQFVLSYRLANIWFDSVRSSSGETFDCRHDDRSVRYLFPNHLVDDVIALANDKNVLLHVDKSTDKNSHVIRECTPTKYEVHPLRVESTFCTPFVNMYEKCEIAARNLAIKYGDRIFSDDWSEKELYQQYVDRLERGYSLPDLLSFFEDYKLDNAQKWAVVSNCLDRMIDRGVVVPTICVEANSAYRAYRHGEDVKFGEAEQGAIFKMLCAYSDEKEKATLPGIEIEKLSVLTTKKVLAPDQHAITKANSNILGQCGTIGVRFSLHGAVLAESSSKIYQSDSKHSIRAILEDSELISKVSRKAGVDSLYENELCQYTIREEKKHFHDNSLPTQVSNKSEKIGMTIGYLRKTKQKIFDKETEKYKTGDLLLNQGELTLLATISDPGDVCAALAAEMQIISSIFNRYLSRFKSLASTVKPNRKELLFTRNTEIKDGKKNNLFVALNSAHWKASNWFNDRLTDLNNKILSESKIDRRVLIDWQEYWPDSCFQSYKAADEDVFSLICLVARLNYYIHIHYNFFALCCFRKSELSSQQNYRDIMTSINEEISTYNFMLARSLGGKGIELPSVRSEINSDVSILSEFADHALKKITNKLFEVEDLLNKTSLMTSQYGKTKSLYDFSHVLVINVNVSDELLESAKVKIFEIIEEAKASFIKGNKKLQIMPWSIALFPAHATKNNNVIAVAAYRMHELEFLVSLISKLSWMTFDFNINFMLFNSLDIELRPFCAEKTNEYYGDCFWKLVNYIRGKVSNERKFINHASCCLRIVSASGALPREIIDEKVYSVIKGDYSKPTIAETERDELFFN